MIRTTGRKTILGMIHVGPLPGTPFFEVGSLDRQRKGAVRDALALQAGGAHGCLVQTVDRVYSPADTCDPARLVAMSQIVAEVIATTGPDFLVGVQVMKNAVTASLALAKLSGANFIRATAWVGATETPFGVVEADPAAFAAYRRLINAEDVFVVADIHSQHFIWRGPAPALHRIAHWAAEAGADAVCAGEATAAATAHLLSGIRRHEPCLPVVLPGHTTVETASAFLACADAVFVGGCLKEPGGVRIDEARVCAYVAAALASDGAGS